VGLIARNSAAQTPERVIHSAKSWLSHSGIDREAALLPWDSTAVQPDHKLSPLDASALYLSYLRTVWNTTLGASDSDALFDKQHIVITVPASFDQDAQKLTLLAARRAGYPPGVRLLEEPQAAFHAWFEHHPHPQALQEQLPVLPQGQAAHVLVCDIGGGTTDLSLFSATFSPDTPPHIERIAVSEHILLGGDNIDLALAHMLERQLSGEQNLNPRSWQSLVNRSRELKEQALSASDAAPHQEYRVAISEPGSSLFTQAKVARLSHSAIMELIYEGFFPRCSADARPQANRSGLRELGLPYAQDSAVTRYLADFLKGRPRIDAVLFNGGTLTPLAIRERLIEQLGLWQDSPPVMLDNNEPYLAVARGAAQFGAELALNHHRLITANAAHGFYIEITPEQQREASYLVCVLPLGSGVEELKEVSKLDLHLRVNQPIEFRAFSTVRRSGDHVGQLLKYNDTDFHPLPPLHTIARLESGADKLRAESIAVTLEAKMNALGLLQIYLVSASKAIVPPRRWELELNIRQAVGGQQEVEQKAQHSLQPLDGELREAVNTLLRSRFDQSILKRLEELSGQRKESWSLLWLREWWKVLFDSISRRNQSSDYEAGWLNAAGYFLRPGYGVTLDDYRMEQLWNLHSLELAHPQVRVVREQEWILWRRVSGGLGAAQQQTLYQQVRPLIAAHVKQSNEAMRMASSFEHLPRAQREELLTMLLQGVVDKRDALKGPYLWSLGRLLSRVPLYGGEESILPAQYVERCFELMGSWEWRGVGLEYLPTLFALACRKVDNRSIDVSPALRSAVLEKLQQAQARPALIRQVAQYVALEREDVKVLFGESLPAGLTIKAFS
jgi:hypothetical protein